MCLDTVALTTIIYGTVAAFQWWASAVARAYFLDLSPGATNMKYLTKEGKSVPERPTS